MVRLVKEDLDEFDEFEEWKKQKRRQPREEPEDEMEMLTTLPKLFEAGAKFLEQLNTLIAVTGVSLPKGGKKKKVIGGDIEIDEDAEFHLMGGGNEVEIE